MPKIFVFCKTHEDIEGGTPVFYKETPYHQAYVLWWTSSHKKDNNAQHLFIPGDFCRQIDIVQSAIEQNKHVFLERGGFLTPSDLVRVTSRFPPENITVVEPGSFFGYDDRILDVRVLEFYAIHNLSVSIHLDPLIPQENSAWTQPWLCNWNLLKGIKKIAETYQINTFFTSSHNFKNVQNQLNL